MVPAKENGAAPVVEAAEATTEALLSLLSTSEQGLGDIEAAARLRRYGPNCPPRPRRRHWSVDLAGQMIHLFALLLWVAALLAWWLGMPELGGAVIGVIVINGVFSFWQQFRAEQAVQALESLLPRRVRVRRGGVESIVAADEVVPGDLLLLAEGDAIPADARLVRAERLRIDLSSLTGESRPVSRQVPPCHADGRPAAELPNLVLAGTFVASGRGEAIVYATGARTEFGRLAALTHEQPTLPSPLQREMRRITRLISLLAITMGIAFFALGWGLGRLTLVEGFLFALGIIVANVPEGLLPTISLSLAIGVRRMAARRAIVKRLERVEALGAVTVVVTDKTGTLTRNQMTVRGLWCNDVFYDVSGQGYEPSGSITPAVGTGGQRSEPKSPASSGGAEVGELLRAAALCCDARLLPPDQERPRWSAVGDPTEAALLVAAAKAGLDAPRLAMFQRLAELPFDSVRKRMTTVQQGPRGPFACTKGAADEVLPRCSQTLATERPRIEAAARTFADRGWRVLAVATRELPTDIDLHDSQASSDVELGASGTGASGSGVGEHESIESELVFLGLVAMEDPPRAEVPPAIASCRAAGIRVIMATGDDGHTAAAIGREIGLVGDAVRIVTGAELSRTSDYRLGMLLGDPHVLFARVSPSQKLRLVESLQGRGAVVAVTGDGVNDAPALKRADVGVAMGASGTDVARAAADMILLDDNFATIVAAVEEGRSVFDNVRKFVTYIFASNVPEIVPFIAFALLRIPLPLTVMQILAVDLGTDLLPALALGVEPPEPDVMRRPPRRPDQPLLRRGMLLRAYAWLGMIEAALGLAGFLYVYWRAGWRPGQTLAESGPLYLTATTMSLAGIVACQLGNGLACRSERRSILGLGLFTNRPLLWAMLAEILVLLALIHVPPLAKLFGLAPLAPSDWLVLAAFGPALLACEELRKRWLQSRP